METKRRTTYWRNPGCIYINEGVVLDTLENRLQRWLLEKGYPVVYTTHEELAGHLGSAREVISRQLKKWEKEGKVKLFRGRIEVIDL